jgi:hypothetical protein
MKIQFKKIGLDNVKVIILDKPTGSQAETLYQTIKKENIRGGIFIKDADGYYKAEISKRDSVAIFPLEELDVVDPKHKSYVSVDDMFYITNMIEKRVISHYFNAGGYCFENSEDFCTYYETISEHEKHLYISHIIYAMLLDKKIFRPFIVKEYKDYGSDKLFYYYTQKR